MQHGRQRRLTEKTEEEIKQEQMKAAKLQKAGLLVLSKVVIQKSCLYCRSEQKTTLQSLSS